MTNKTVEHSYGYTTSMKPSARKVKMHKHVWIKSFWDAWCKYCPARKRGEGRAKP